MSEYAEGQIRDLLERGPYPDEDFYRLKVTGNGETKWVNVTHDELTRIASVLNATHEQQEYIDALVTARALVEREVLDEGFANEYLRGMTNLLADLFGTHEMFVDERMDEVLADLRALTCEACGTELCHVGGEELVEIRQSAPPNAPGQDACCDDEVSWRCCNPHCVRFAHPVPIFFHYPQTGVSS